MSTFRGGDDVDLETAARAAGEAMESWLRQYDGYLGLVILTSQESGTAHALTFWDTAETANQSRVGRAQMRDKMASTIGVDVVATEPYAVSFRDGPNF